MKYYLVDPVKYEKLVKSHKLHESKVETDNMFNHPNVKEVQKLDKEMTNALNDKSLTDYEKNEEFNSRLTDFVRNFQSAIKTPKAEAIFGKSPEKDSNTSLESLSVKSLDEEIAKIPESYQPKARKLLQFITKNKSFSWNKSGELKYKDSPIVDADVATLLNDAVRNKKLSSSNMAYNKFISALKSEGYPVKQFSSLQRNKILSNRISPRVVKRVKGIGRKRSSLSSSGRNILDSWKSS